MATDNKVSAVSARRLRLSLAPMDAWRAGNDVVCRLRPRGANRRAGDTSSRPGPQVTNRKATSQRRLYFSPLLISHNVLRGLTAMSIRGCAAPFFPRSERNAA